MKENRTILLGGQAVEYQLTRKKVKNINLRIKADGQILVSASNAVPLKTIDAFLGRHADYLLQHLARLQSRPKPAPKQYVNGETFAFLGQSLVLQVIENEAESVFVLGDQLLLLTKFPADTERKAKQIHQFYTEQSHQFLMQVVDQLYPLFEQMGIAYPTVKFRRMKSQWGSCMPRKGQINLNVKLMEHPKSFIEYVVLHEFCHFVHADHSKNFYALVEQLMPDWKARKATHTIGSN